MKKSKSANPAGEATGAAKTPKPIRMPSLPRKDSDIDHVTKRVATKWQNTPEITLVWTDSGEFTEKARVFSEVLGSKTAVAGARSAKTQSVKSLDQQINKAVGRIKTAIQNQWDDKDVALAQYGRYGIVKEGGSYRLPVDRQKRFNALSLMITAVTKDGTGGEKWGAEFWTGIQADYEAALSETTGSKSSESGHTADKNGLKKELRKVMEALQLVIRANYPDDFEARFREWGWHKESY